MSLDRVRRVYEDLGEDDPLWAVLTDDSRRHGKWDPEEFFETGRVEIAGVFELLDGLAVSVARDAALDFGCGAGRLTQALAERFDQVLGIDISHTMIEVAERFNTHGDRVRFVANTSERLEGVDDGSFDFVYSNITLQHSPPRYQLAYLREFLRVLKPGGVAVLQFRIGPDRPEGTLRELWYRCVSEHLKPLGKRLRGRPPVQVHVIGKPTLRAAIEAAGGRVVAAVDTDERRRRSRRSLRFVITSGPKPATAPVR
jgi:SAM-dependent methyltransferase